MKLSTLLRPLLVAGLLSTGLLNARAQAPGPEMRCLMQLLPEAERVQQSRLIVEGEVLRSESFWDAAHQRIYTAHRLRIYKVFQGQNTGPELTLLTEGGTVGLNQQRLTNTLTLAPGEQGVFYLAPATFAGTTPTGSWMAYGSEQGFIRYDLASGTAAEPFRQYAAIDQTFYARLEAATGKALRPVQPNQRLQEAAVRRQTAVGRPQAVLISTLTPLRITAGTGQVLTIRGTGFGATRGNGFVEFRNADDGGETLVKPQPTDYVSWTNSEIKVLVPTYGEGGKAAGSGTVRVTTNGQDAGTSVATLTVVYAVSTVQEQNSKDIVRPNHANRNGRGGYTIQPTPGFISRGALPAFARALATWRCNTGVNWEVGDSRTGKIEAEDNVNALGFDASDSQLPARVLGRTTSYYTGCRRPDGQIVFAVKEFDMVFDDAQSWQYGPGLPSATQYDFESVVLHELGHAQQLSHLILPGAVMHYAYGRQQSSRELNPESDIAGGRFVLTTRSFRNLGCGPAAMLPAPLVRVDPQTVLAGQNQVFWTTTAECFVTEFVIERSLDTLTWEPIGRVAATDAGSYSITDATPPAGRPYYRVGVVRPDGIIDYAAPARVRDSALAANNLELFPNPVTDETPNIQFLIETEGQLLLRVYDAVGRLLQTQVLTLQPGLNIVPLRLPPLRAGWHVLRWSDYKGHEGQIPFIRGMN
ncbi:matrixin family metalloprotease [Hymenobacter sp. DG25A]|uniref:matrixin family metalloprotease n=1 Tax=Hymenobacter sp. DG25A TaxID=1385663 RepID=UPI0006C8BF7F|nr:matrixin family metalloprotease [Hymenobacter sp. DG25A]